MADTNVYISTKIANKWPIKLELYHLSYKVARLKIWHTIKVESLLCHLYSFVDSDPFSYPMCALKSSFKALHFGSLAIVNKCPCLILFASRYTISMEIEFLPHCLNTILLRDIRLPRQFTRCHGNQISRQIIWLRVCWVECHQFILSVLGICTLCTNWIGRELLSTLWPFFSDGEKEGVGEGMWRRTDETRKKSHGIWRCLILIMWNQSRNTYMTNIENTRVCVCV